MKPQDFLKLKLGDVIRLSQKGADRKILKINNNGYSIHLSGIRGKDIVVYCRGDCKNFVKLTT